MNVRVKADVPAVSATPDRTLPGQFDNDRRAYA